MNRAKTEISLYPHLFSCGEIRGKLRTWYPGKTGIFCAGQFTPQLASIRSTPNFFSSPVSRMVCSMSHCSHFPSESRSFPGPSAQSEALSRTKRLLSRYHTDGLDYAEHEAYAILERGRLHAPVSANDGLRFVRLSLGVGIGHIERPATTQSGGSANRLPISHHTIATQKKEKQCAIKEMYH
jgi:hypothetical protein